VKVLVELALEVVVELPLEVVVEGRRRVVVGGRRDRSPRFVCDATLMPA
jgi:hypothetical protein